MSSLNSLFNRGLLGAKCKTCLTLSISRIKLLRNKREVQLMQMRKDIFRFLQTGQEAIARIRVEHVIREQNILAAYEIIELFCEFILARVPILDTTRTCPDELKEAIASVIFAAPRCADVPELIQIKNLLATKYGKEFISSASDLRPDSGVNREIIEKLSVKAPPADEKLAVLKGIATGFNLDWDSSKTEAEFSKRHEDLLDGSNLVNAEGATERSSSQLPLSKQIAPAIASNQDQSLHSPGSPAAIAKDRCPIYFSNPAEATGKLSNDNHMDKPVVHENPTTIQSPDGALERARAAIANAERASAAAREAAKLVHARVYNQSRNNGQFSQLTE